MKNDKSVKKEIIAGVVVAAIVGVGSWFLGLLQIAITKVIGIFRIGLSFLGDRVVMPRWYYYLLFLCVPALFACVGLGIRARAKKQEEVISFREYQRDTFFGVIWHWGYLGSGEIYENSLAPYCPSDDTLLVKNTKISFDYENAEFYCETCRNVYTPREGSANTLIGKVIRQIDRKIRVGEWREVVKSRTLQCKTGESG